MNEISNFCTGSCSDENNKAIQDSIILNKRAVKFDPNNPPYAIDNANDQSPLDKNTAPADAVHVRNRYRC